MKNFTIKIFGKDIKVEFFDFDDIGEGNKYGQAHLIEGKIRLHKKAPKDILLQSLLHEIIHFWNEDLGLGLDPDDEEAHRTIDRLATAFTMLCKENNINIEGLLHGV